jgi:hypothetical protein
MYQDESDSLKIKRLGQHILHFQVFCVIGIVREHTHRKLLYVGTEHSHKVNASYLVSIFPTP